MAPPSVTPSLTPSPGTSPLGHGRSIAHHGEILQGAFVDAEGDLHRGLVTLPCFSLRAEAFFRSGAGTGLLVRPSWKVKALEAMRRTLAYLGEGDRSAELVVYAPIPACWGLGSSTSDVIATIRSVANAFGQTLPPKVVAAISVRSEIASDAVMFEDRAVLFAQREGFVIEDLGDTLPPLDVLGVNADPDGGVDTLLIPPIKYSDAELENLERLRCALRRAVAEQDAGLAAEVASTSARINQSHLPKPSFDWFERLVEAAGGLGLQVAHSGSVLGLLFDPTRSDHGERMAMARQRLIEAGFHRSWRFSTRPAERNPGRTARRGAAPGMESLWV